MQVKFWIATTVCNCEVKRQNWVEEEMVGETQAQMGKQVDGKEVD